MARRRRRGRRSRRLAEGLRRYLIEHRFHAAQGLAWPGRADRRAVAAVARAAGHRHRSSRRLAAQPADGRPELRGRNEAFRDGLVAATECEPRRSRPGGAGAGRASTLVDEPPAKPRLAQIARTMPAIGVPDGGPATARSVSSRSNSPAGMLSIEARRGGDRSAWRHRCRDRPCRRRPRRGPGAAARAPAVADDARPADLAAQCRCGARPRRPSGDRGGDRRSRAQPARHRRPEPAQGHR